MTQANPFPTPDQVEALALIGWQSLSDPRLVKSQSFYHGPSDSGIRLRVGEPPKSEGDPREIAKAAAILWPDTQQKRIAQLEGLRERVDAFLSSRWGTEYPEEFLDALMAVLDGGDHHG